MNENIVRLRISAQNALVGKITEELRAVYVKIVNKTIYFNMVFDGEISEYWTEMAPEITTEILADFYDFNIVEEFIRQDYPTNLNYSDFICIYKRYEP